MRVILCKIVKYSCKTTEPAILNDHLQAFPIVVNYIGIYCSRAEKMTIFFSKCLKILIDKFAVPTEKELMILI